MCHCRLLPGDFTIFNDDWHMYVVIFTIYDGDWHQYLVIFYHLKAF